MIMMEINETVELHYNTIYLCIDLSFHFKVWFDFLLLRNVDKAERDISTAMWIQGTRRSRECLLLLLLLLLRFSYRHADGLHCWSFSDGFTVRVVTSDLVIHRSSAQWILR